MNLYRVRLLDVLNFAVTVVRHSRHWNSMSSKSVNVEANLCCVPSVTRIILPAVRATPIGQHIKQQGTNLQNQLVFNYFFKPLVLTIKTERMVREIDTFATVDTFSWDVKFCTPIAKLATDRRLIKRTNSS